MPTEAIPLHIAEAVDARVEGEFFACSDVAIRDHPTNATNRPLVNGRLAAAVDVSLWFLHQDRSVPEVILMVLELPLPGVKRVVAGNNAAVIDRKDEFASAKG